ncbi:MAG: hypothetical protein EAX89_04760 [Candidatus Lokiarchaeota archaeon]|nr:hypothetical protein [Candidatus Lokiarchaeota archaeon]
MSSDNVEVKDGMKIRKLTELKTGAEKEYEEAMLKRVEYFKKQNVKKSGFNSLLENTLFTTFSSILDLKLNIDKAIGEENLKKVHKVIDEVLLFGL